MRNFLCVISVLVSTAAYAQLPPKAQALYDSAYAQDPTLANTALANGAQIKATPDGSSFYLQWFPTGANPSTAPLIVTLPGSHCNAFMEYKSWHPQAQLHGCGILALQWYRYRPTPPLDYFPDDTIYSYLDSALTRINYPAGKALLHGFSRGSARSYAIVFEDMQSGNNYFCTTISNSGDADVNYPLYDSITQFGQNVFAGKHWNLFCGGKDTTVGCAKMASTQTWLQSQGATVDIFIQDLNLDHDGFQLPSSSAYKDSILDNYLLCFNGTLGIGEETQNTSIKVSPNPFNTSATLRIANGRITNPEVALFDVFGKKFEMDVIRNSEGFVILRNGLKAGIYFYRILEENSTLHTGTLIIAD